MDNIENKDNNGEQKKNDIEILSIPVLCDSCEQASFINSLIKTSDSMSLCQECINTDYFKCVECAEYFLNDEKKDHNGDDYCDTCYCDNIFTCEECDETTHNDDMRSVNDKILCDKCYNANYSNCDGCSEDYNNNELNSPSDSSRSYCGDCLSENTTYCEGCNEYFINARESEDGNYYCRDCYPDNGCQASNITSETFEKTNNIKRAFGVEIECLKPNDENIVKSKYFDRVEDGSIDEIDDFEGEERRSGKIQGDKGIDAILAFCKDLTNTGYIVNRSTGLHVHVNMKDLKDKEIANILSFCKLYDNMLFHLMPKSRRGNTYCGELEVSKRQLKQIIAGERTIQGMDGACRYRGTNIQAFFKHDTLEFRYHSGTVDGNKIAHWVNLCLAIVEIGKIRFWAKSNFLNTSKATLSNLKRMLAILGQSEEQKEYWEKRFKKFNNMPVVLATEESEVKYVRYIRV